MIGTGVLIVSHEKGWACSKEACIDMEFDVMPDKTAKKTMVVTMKSLFDCVGEAKGMVKGMFKFDAGNKISFDGIMQGKGRLTITGQVNNNFDIILKEVKKWQEYYQEN